MLDRIYQKIFPPHDYHCFGQYVDSNSACYYCDKRQECWEKRYLSRIKTRIVEFHRCPHCGNFYYSSDTFNQWLELHLKSGECPSYLE